MKEAIIVDTNGFFQNVELVPNDTFGVFSIYETPAASETEDEPPVESPEPVLVGYRVAVPVPPGLYWPRFDVEGWRDAVAAYETSLEEYRKAMAVYDPESGEPEPQPPAPVDLHAFWVEGLTPEEIEAIRNAPKIPSEIDIIGEQLVQRELEVLELQQQNSIIGQALVEKDLQILDLQQQNNILGQQLVDLELRLLQLEGGAGA